jgi:hypothetical protein
MPVAPPPLKELTAAAAQGAAIMFTVSQAIFGYGVGGEYSMASATASERAEEDSDLRKRRGEVVVSTFAMRVSGRMTDSAVTCANAVWPTAHVAQSTDSCVIALLWNLSLHCDFFGCTVAVLWAVLVGCTMPMLRFTFFILQLLDIVWDVVQGWGNFVNTTVLIVLLSIKNGKYVYAVHRIDTVWRLSFALGLIPIAFMIFYRVFRLKETKVSWVAVPDPSVLVASRALSSTCSCVCGHGY